MNLSDKGEEGTKIQRTSYVNGPCCILCRFVWGERLLPLAAQSPSVSQLHSSLASPGPSSVWRGSDVSALPSVREGRRGRLTVKLKVLTRHSSSLGSMTTLYRTLGGVCCFAAGSSSAPLEVCFGVMVLVWLSASEWLALELPLDFLCLNALFDLALMALPFISSPTSSVASLAASLNCLITLLSSPEAAADLHEQRSVTRILDKIPISSLPDLALPPSLRGGGASLAL